MTNESAHDSPQSLEYQELVVDAEKRIQELKNIIMELSNLLDENVIRDLVTELSTITQVKPQLYLQGDKWLSLIRKGNVFSTLHLGYENTLVVILDPRGMDLEARATLCINQPIDEQAGQYNTILRIECGDKECRTQVSVDGDPNQGFLAKRVTNQVKQAVGDDEDYINCDAVQVRTRINATKSKIFTQNVIVRVEAINPSTGNTEIRSKYLTEYVPNKLNTLITDVMRSSIATKFEQAALTLNLKALLHTIRPYSRIKMESECKAHNLPFMENPGRRDFSQIVSEGIELYKSRNPEERVFWHSARRQVDVSDLLQTVLSLPHYTTDHSENIIKLLKEIVLNVRNNDIRVSHTLTIKNAFMNKLSGDRARAENRILRAEDLFVGHKPVFSIDDLEDSTEPISTSEIFARCLQLRGGNIFLAIELCADTIKSLIRGNEGTGQVGYDAKNPVQRRGADVLRSKLKDEFSDFLPFNDLPLDEIIDTNSSLPSNDLAPDHTTGKGEALPIFNLSLPGRLGEVYHAWDLLSLTLDFDIPTVIAMAFAEYAHSGKEHGEAKLLSDIRVLLELPKIHKELRRLAII